MSVLVAEDNCLPASTIAIHQFISAALQTVAGTIDKPLALIESNDFVALVNDHIGATTLPNATDGDIIKAMDKISELVTLVRNTANAVDALAAYTPVAVSAVTSATDSMRSYAETLAGIVSQLSEAYSTVDPATKLSKLSTQKRSGICEYHSRQSGFCRDDASRLLAWADGGQCGDQQHINAANAERRKKYITSSYETVSG
jgi:hypothetical protein